VQSRRHERTGFEDEDEDEDARRASSRSVKGNEKVSQSFWVVVLTVRMAPMWTAVAARWVRQAPS
jgi:hypothetical protein